MTSCVGPPGELKSGCLDGERCRAVFQTWDAWVAEVDQHAASSNRIQHRWWTWWGRPIDMQRRAFTNGPTQRSARRQECLIALSVRNACSLDWERSVKYECVWIAFIGRGAWVVCRGNCGGHRWALQDGPVDGEMTFDERLGGEGWCIAEALGTCTRHEPPSYNIPGPISWEIERARFT
jgi:hypothetical protein